jgi:hypothetical protein
MHTFVFVSLFGYPFVCVFVSPFSCLSFFFFFSFFFLSSSFFSGCCCCCCCCCYLPAKTTSAAAKPALTDTELAAASKRFGGAVAAFCAARVGQVHGDGECWTLANDALVVRPTTIARRRTTTTKSLTKTMKKKRKNRKNEMSLECANDFNDIKMQECERNKELNKGKRRKGYLLQEADCEITKLHAREDKRKRIYQNDAKGSLFLFFFFSFFSLFFFFSLSFFLLLLFYRARWLARRPARKRPDSLCLGRRFRARRCWWATLSTFGHASLRTSPATSSYARCAHHHKRRKHAKRTMARA